MLPLCAGDPIISFDPVGRRVELLCNIVDVFRRPTRNLTIAVQSHFVECPRKGGTDSVNLTQVVFGPIFRFVFQFVLRRFRLFHLQTQLTSVRAGLQARSDRSPVSLDAECRSHFDQTLTEASDLLLLFSRSFRLICQILLLCFERLNSLLQSVDLFGSLVQEFFIELELGSEWLLRGKLLL